MLAKRCWRLLVLAICDLARETYHLKSVMPTIGHLPINQVHDGTWRPMSERRLAVGRAHKTVNLELAIVRRILNLCATSWRDDNGTTWLEQAPHITLLPLVGHQREPRPISWPEQRLLLPKLPAHLARMSLFTLNTGARDDVVCSLRWAWEIKVPELGISVFEVPAAHVKGRKRLQAARVQQRGAVRHRVGARAARRVRVRLPAAQEGRHPWERQASRRSRP